MRENLMYAGEDRPLESLMGLMDLSDLDLDVVPGRLSAGPMHKCILIRASLSVLSLGMTCSSSAVEVP